MFDNSSLSEQGHYSLEIEDGKICVRHGSDEGEKHLALVLHPGFFISRKSLLKTKPKNGMPNMKRKIKRESVCVTETQHLVFRKGGGTIYGKVDSGEKYELTFEERPHGLWFHMQCKGADEVGFRFESAPDECFMGFGEQFSHFNMSGKKFSLCVSEKGIGRGAQPLSTLVNLVSKGASGDDFTTYAPMPVFITTDSRAMCFEQSTIYWCDIKSSNKNEVAITAWGDEISGWLFCADNPLELIEKHTSVTGRLKPLPEFAYGVILGVRGGRTFAEQVLSNCLRHDTPVTALWVEDWQGRRGKNGGPPLWWRWYPDDTLYPELKEWTKELSSKDIALLGYVNTFLSADEDKNYLYSEGLNKGYFIKNRDGSPWISSFFTGKEYRYVIVDLTNSDAYSWLKEKMRTGLIENGFSGWMADYGEYLPIDAEVYSGNAVQAHTELPVLWAKLNSEIINEANNRGKLMTFHRSAGVGSNKYATSYWAGDQSPTFDKYNGLQSSITALITSGISGMSINHTDIGGFTTLITPVYKLVRKKEVFLRWLEYAAFTPVFRTHDGGWANKLNYQFYFDEEGYAAFSKFGRIHMSIKWYILELEKDAVQKGLPMVRALYLHYPNEEACKRIQSQFLLGDDILVNPVCELGAEHVRAYLPSGQWICPHSNKVYKGGNYEVFPAPLGKPAVLIRAESSRAKRLLEALAGEFQGDIF
jgi:alpha-glucosidase